MLSWVVFVDSTDEKNCCSSVDSNQSTSSIDIILARYWVVEDLVKILKIEPEYNKQTELKIHWWTKNQELNILETFLHMQNAVVNIPVLILQQLTTQLLHIVIRDML